MKYVSVDIETLGLDPDQCDIIEFGAVIDDMISPIEDLPTFHCYVIQEDNNYQGEPYAMSMHSKILKRIAEREKGYFYVPSDLLDESFADWLALEVDPIEKVTLAGKNFASFDLPFLKNVKFGERSLYHHRILDVGSMYVTKKDQEIPDLKECLRRAGIDKEINHTAVDDAIDVIRCVRYKMSDDISSDWEVIEVDGPDKKTIFKTISERDAKDYVDDVVCHLEECGEPSPTFEICHSETNKSYMYFSDGR